MAWAGTWAFCVIKGGVLKSYSLSRLSEIGGPEAAGELSFVQISDSHMGFNKPANPDVAETRCSHQIGSRTYFRRHGIRPFLERHEWATLVRLSEFAGISSGRTATQDSQIAANAVAAACEERVC